MAARRQWRSENREEAASENNRLAWHQRRNISAAYLACRRRMALAKSAKSAAAYHESAYQNINHQRNWRRENRRRNRKLAEMAWLSGSI
jgi:hypothetical protein